MYIPPPLPQHRLDKMRKEYEEEMRMHDILEDQRVANESLQRDRDKQARKRREKEAEERKREDAREDNPPLRRDERHEKTAIEIEREEYLKNKAENARIDRFNDAVERNT